MDLENSMVLYTDKQFNDYWGDSDDTMLDEDFDDSLPMNEED